MNQEYKIAALPGEGIGIEVVEATLTILQRLAQKHNFQLQIDYGAISKSTLKKYGFYFPKI